MDAVTLRYSTNTSTHTEIAPAQQSAPEVRQGAVAVTMAATRLAIDDGERLQLFDFDRRRRQVMTHADRSIRDASLFAYAHDRESGLASAVHAMRVLRAGGGMLDSATWQFEAAYGLPWLLGEPEPAPSIERETTSEQVHWRIDGRRVTSLQPLPDPPQLPAGGLRRLLTHALSVHPGIADDIVATASVPKQLWIDDHNPLWRTVTTLELDRVEHAQLDFESLAAGYVAAAPTDPTLALIRDGAPASSRDFRLDDAREALAQGRHFEALLAVFAHSFARAEKSPELVRSIFDGARWLSPVKRIPALVGPPGSPEQARKQIAKLAKLRAKAGAYGHVLDVLRGDKLLELGEVDRANEALSSALRHDPGLAATWVSLGRTHIRALRFGDGWDCWEFADAQCPEHEVLGDVHRMSASLRARHPNLF